MPAYRFFSLPRTDASEVTEQVFYSDSVAMLWALRSSGETGAEIWEGSRFVGRIHAGAANSPNASDPCVKPHR